MSVAKWSPQDAELDGLARSLAPDEAPSDRAEQNRTYVLAGAASVAQQPRSSRLPMIVTTGLALAASAAAVVWIVGRSREDSDASIAVVAPAAARDAIVASVGANFERVASWPDARVRVREGRVSFEVGALRAEERYQVVTADAEVEIRGTRFVVEVSHDRLTTVFVDEGSVEVRMPSRDPMTLTAGERWSASRTAHLDPFAPDPISVAIGPTTKASMDRTTTVESSRPALPARQRAPRQHIADPHEAGHAQSTPVPARNGETAPRATAPPPVPTKSPNLTTRVATSSAEKPDDVRNVAPTPAKLVDRTTSSVVVPPPTAAKPGEEEFRRGWSLLRGGDSSGAATAFGRACKDLGSDSLSEDVCYWAGAAAKRAGQDAAAREALTKFMTRFPISTRAAEASALLGWLLYEAGDLPGGGSALRARCEGSRTESSSERRAWTRSDQAQPRSAAVSQARRVHGRIAATS